MIGTVKSDLYGALAEVFSDPPDWLALPGCEWPLYSTASNLDLSSIGAQQAIERIKRIPPEPIAIRQERYDALFSGPGRPRFWLHESLYRSGKLFGTETIEVEGIYRTAGLAIEGAELPDHASMELDFLAYVANQQVGSDGQSGTWLEIESTFIKAHAGLWLPALGRDLAGSGDEVYAPIGQLLAEWLTDNRKPIHHGVSSQPGTWSPVLVKAENCILCGFCYQVCPRQVLKIQEDSGETVLIRIERSCTGCGKCVKICPERVLKLEKSIPSAQVSGGMVVLRASPRAQCPKCGFPTVSQAELNYIVGQTGSLPWIEWCQECRLASMEEMQ